MKSGGFSCRWGRLYFAAGTKGGGTARSGSSMRHFHMARSSLFSGGCPLLFGFHNDDTEKSGETIATPPETGEACGRV